ncbi:MAG: cytochrome C biogenesis protein CycH, partial [Bacteroidales bacterium]|nr:cytochrome C biogenesis protein CycH [Bacteroidales bacterium]
MNNSSIEIYRSPEGTVELDVKLENETVWLTQEQMSILFGRDRTVITKHINNIYNDNELEEASTCSKME